MNALLRHQLEASLAERLPYETKYDFRARQARMAETEKMLLATDKIERRRKALRRAYNDLPDGPGYGSGPDEDDAALIDAFDLAKDLLRQAHAERRALRLAQANGMEG